jgi:hypothetical protein
MSAHFYKRIMAACTFLVVALVTSYSADARRKSKAFVDDCAVVLDRDFIKLNDSVYVYKYEMSNCRYKTFLTNLEAQGKTELLEICYPDSNWGTLPYTADASVRVMEKYYFKNKAYDQYPVVNVSRRAALAYCAWLTEQLQMQYPNAQLVARLPNYGEWEEFSGLAGLRRAEKNYRSLFTEKAFNYFFPPIVADYGTNAKTSFFAHTASYKQNLWGCHNCFGNAAEMLSDMQVAVGGSCFDKVYEMPDDMLYTSSKSPSPLVGFRIVVVQTAMQ